MKRNVVLFPQDNTGNALWKMQVSGDDLSKIREIEFCVLFSTKQSALDFGKLLLADKQKLSLTSYNDPENKPIWEITVYPEIAAHYEQVNNFKQKLQQAAGVFHGQFDSWYCVDARQLPY